MNDILTMLKTLTRPQLLIRAARIGQEDYNRARDLRRLIKTSTLPSPGKAIMSLMSQESELEAGRKEGSATYSVTRHVEVLVAVMGEARLLAATRA